MKKNMLSNIALEHKLKNQRYLQIITCVCLLLSIGCKAKKQLVTIKPVIADSTRIAVKAAAAPAVSKLAAIKLAQLYFNTFNGKAKAKLNINGSTNDVTLNIRIKRDQKIWVSVTAIAGIEVARALITPDSILLINRLQSLYIRQPFSFVYKFTGNRVNYKTVETLLTGNAMPELINDDTAIQTTANTTVLTGSLQDLIYKLILGDSLKVTQENLGNRAEGQSLQVNNSVFTQTANKLVPSQIDITSMVKAQKIQVNLHYIKIDFDQPLDYPFSIPSRYQPGS